MHVGAAVWGLTAVGLFVGEDELGIDTTRLVGLFHGGGFKLLGVQLLGVVCILAWSVSYRALYSPTHTRPNFLPVLLQ